MKQNKINPRKVALFTRAGLLTLFLVFAFACEEERVGQNPVDNIPPSAVSNVQIEALPGGAKITYDLPNETDISYVICEYMFKGEKKVMRSSIYSNFLVIEGLPDISPCEFTLYLVDHSENASDSYTGSFVPLEPPYQTISKTISMEPDFGGVVIRWHNETKAMIGAFLLAKDDEGEWVEYDLVFSTIEEEIRSIRGYDTEEREFGIVLVDRYGNTSDTVVSWATPLFEMELNKSSFSNAALNGDNYTSHSSRPIENIWDDNISVIWHTSPTAGFIPPQTFTVDLGVEAKLSRLMLWNRQDDYIFAQHNVHYFEVWGAKELSHDRNNAYWLGTGWKDEWVLLGDFEQIKPSGLPLGQSNADDVAATVAGSEFIFESGADEVRYLRFVVKETWARTAALHIAEITLFGDDGSKEGGDDNAE